MTSRNPDTMTLEEIKEQLALYNRLYYQRRRHEKEFMETKRLSAIRHHRRKKLNELIEDGNIALKEIDYENKNENEHNQNTVKATKPRKYKGTTYNLISTT